MEEFFSDIKVVGDVEAIKLKKTGGIGNNILLDDGSTLPISNISKNITIRRVLIPTTELPANFTSTDVKNWLNANQSIGENEVLFWETIGEVITVTLAVNILTPTEGQEITGDVNITFELFNESSINILTPTEGQEITGDVNITFEIL